MDGMGGFRPQQQNQPPPGNPGLGNVNFAALLQQLRSGGGAGGLSLPGLQGGGGGGGGGGGSGSLGTPGGPASLPMMLPNLQTGAGGPLGGNFSSLPSLAGLAGAGAGGQPKAPDAGALLALLQGQLPGGAAGGPAALGGGGPAAGLGGLLGGLSMPGLSPIGAPLGPPGAGSAGAGGPPPVTADEEDPEGLKPLADYDIKVTERAVREALGRSKTKEQLIKEFAGQQRPEVAEDLDPVYVVLQASSHDMVHLSVLTGMWSVAPGIEDTLSKPFQDKQPVVLIFMLQNSNHFLGYALMTTQVLPRSDHAQVDETLPGSWQKLFRVSWVRVGGVSFSEAEHVSNANDGGRSVTLSQDGQTLSTSAGAALCNLIDAASVPSALRTGVSRHAATHLSSRRNKLRIDVTNMTYEQYYLAVLTKRRQRLKEALRLREKLGIKKPLTPAPGTLGGASGAPLALPSIPASLASFFPNASGAVGGGAGFPGSGALGGGGGGGGGGSGNALAAMQSMLSAGGGLPGFQGLRT